MSIIWNNRRLTSKEMQLHKKGKCICCGIEIGNKFECSACCSARTRIHQDDWAHQQYDNHSYWQLRRQAIQFLHRYTCSTVYTWEIVYVLCRECFIYVLKLQFRLGQMFPKVRLNPPRSGIAPTEGRGYTPKGNIKPSTTKRRRDLKKERDSLVRRGNY